MSTIKRPWTVWFRVVLGTVLARFHPTSFDPLFRGTPSWRLAFRMAAQSWGYYRSPATTPRTFPRTRWIMRSHDGSLWATLWAYTEDEVHHWQLSKPVRPLLDQSVPCGTIK